MTLRARKTRARTLLTLALAASYVAWTAAIPVGAVERIGDAALIEVRHLDKRIKIVGGTESTLHPRNTYQARKRDGVSVVLMDKNPLLFNYRVQRRLINPPGGEAVTAFATSLLAALSALRTGGGDGDNRLLIENFSLALFLSRLQEIDRQIGQLKSRIAASTQGEAAVKQLKADVLAFDVAKHRKELDDDWSKVNDIVRICRDTPRGLSTNAGVVLSCSDYSSLTTGTVQQLQDSMKERAKGGTGAANQGLQPPAPSVLPPGQQPTPPISNNPAPQPGIGAGRGQVVTQPSGQAQNAGRGRGAGAAPAGEAAGRSGAAEQTVAAPQVAAPVAESIFGLLLTALAQRSETDKRLGVLTVFAADVAKLHEPESLDDGEYAVATEEITVTMEANKYWENYLDAGTKETRDGALKEFTISLEAYSPVVLSPGVSAILLFIENPTFKAVKSGDQYVIQSVDEEVTSYSLGAMLNITPRAWNEPTFGGSFQLGVSPTKDRIGFYAGAGVNVQQIFGFGAGVAWQQVDNLAEGLIVGQGIASPELLKTGTRFKPGFYINGTVKLK